MIAEIKDITVQDTIRELTVTELDQVAGGNPPRPRFEIEHSFNNSFNGSFNNNSFNGVANTGLIGNHSFNVPSPPMVA